MAANRGPKKGSGDYATTTSVRQTSVINGFWMSRYVVSKVIGQDKPKVLIASCRLSDTQQQYRCTIIHMVVQCSIQGKTVRLLQVYMLIKLENR